MFEFTDTVFTWYVYWPVALVVCIISQVVAVKCAGVERDAAFGVGIFCGFFWLGVVTVVPTMLTLYFLADLVLKCLPDKES